MKKILVLGGTRFFGMKAVRCLLEKGHQVTIATRGNRANPFPSEAEHVELDAQESSHPGWEQLTERSWDAVFTNITYTADDARLLIDKFRHQTQFLYITSTMAVYQGAKAGYCEKDFNPFCYQINPNQAVDYGEGKRQAETVLFNESPFTVTAFRFPIVLDADDYTERLHYYIEQILDEQPIHFHNPDARVNFVKGTQAAETISWSISNKQTGIFNISSADAISIETLIDWLEEATGKKAKVVYDKQAPVDLSISPFNTPHDRYLISDKIQATGFELKPIASWLKPLMAEIVSKMESVK